MKLSPSTNALFLWIFSRRLLSYSDNSLLWSSCFGTKYPVLYDVNKHCNPQNNYFGLSSDKTDHVIQNWTMVIRQYPPFNLISVIWFYFDGIKAKKWASVQAKLLICHWKQKNKFAEASLCPQSFASQPAVHFSDNLSALGIILWYTSPWKGFIY